MTILGVPKADVMPRCITTLDVAYSGESVCIRSCRKRTAVRGREVGACVRCYTCLSGLGSGFFCFSFRCFSEAEDFLGGLFQGESLL